MWVKQISVKCFIPVFKAIIHYQDRRKIESQTLSGQIICGGLAIVKIATYIANPEKPLGDITGSMRRTIRKENPRQGDRLSHYKISIASPKL